MKKLVSSLIMWQVQNEEEEKGSAAITSDKGLFFINPTKSDSLKPVQIWTQGETENNSRWFPTIDKPNERCTEEITLTVEDKFSTLSNGKLISSVKNPDGTRTDYWKQDKPHAPYLFMIAVGEYATIEDRWQDVPLYYMVEKPFAPYAKQIFNHTPEMIGFFSELFNYKYPWDKYTQVVTRDYVSGAMENTSAVVFGEFVQKTDRELIDNDNDYIVAHELSHHWFGDLVTMESWANLTLNEGFANYAEYLWQEHKYGKMRADEHRQNELNGYLTSAFNSNLHPLIHYRYADKEDMFDAHSYNKGGLVLHYLRNYLGDDAFFASLAHYLQKYQYTAVEVDELRMAFEDVTGEDLNWFFDQWYLRKGHVNISTTSVYNETQKKLTITAKQDEETVFKIPFDIAVYSANGEVKYYRKWTTGISDTFTIVDIDQKPLAVVFDGKNVVPGVIDENKSDEEWFNTFKASPYFADKYKAYQMIDNENPLKEDLIELAFNDDYYYFKDLAGNAIIANGNEEKYKDKFIEMCTKAEHSMVRETALRSLTGIEYQNKINLLENILKNEKAYNVIGEALSQLYIQDPVKTRIFCKNFEKENSAILDNKIAMIYSESSNAEDRAWFENKVASSNPYQMFELCSYYNIFLLNQDKALVNGAIKMYTNIGKNPENNKYKRYIGTASLFSLKNLMLTQKMEGGKNTDDTIKEISKAITSIKVAEKDSELLERYSEF